MSNQTVSNTPPLLDICENRHRGNPESVAGNLKVDKHAGRRSVIEILKGGNFTAKEIAFRLGKPLHTLSGRCAELKMLGIIEATGNRREGAAELRIK